MAYTLAEIVVLLQDKYRQGLLPDHLREIVYQCTSILNEVSRSIDGDNFSAKYIIEKCDEIRYLSGQASNHIKQNGGKAS